MNSRKSELLLIKAFKNGDSNCFEKLFQCYHRKLFAYLMHLINSKEDAEEIVQETFIRIWEKKEDFNEKYPFDSFLFKIAKNIFLNYNRKKINQNFFLESFYYFDDLSFVGADDYIILKETRDIVYKKIDKLPPRRKEIFLLKRIEGFSRCEIADKLGISVTTVDSQLQKASKYLKNELNILAC